jgi:spore germination protein
MRLPKKNTESYVSPYQAFAFVHLSIIGVGVLTLPRDVAEKVGPDGIWVILLSGLFSIVILFFITRLTQRFPHKTFVQFVPEILGTEKYPWMGRLLIIPILLLFTVVFLFATAAAARIFGQAVVEEMLPNTPISFVLLSLIIITVIPASASPGTVARLNELLFPLSFIPLLVMIVVLIQRGEIINLLPLFQSDWLTLLSSIFVTTFAFSGYQIVIFLAGYYQKPQKSLLPHTIGLVSIMIWYLIAFVSALSVFGQDEIQNIKWPVIEMVRESRVSLFLFERLEPFLLSVWAITVFISMSNIFFTIVGTIAQFFGIDDRQKRKIAWMLVPLIYGLALYPKDLIHLFEWTGYIGWVITVSSAVIPPILLIIAWIRKKKGEASDATSS